MADITPPPDLLDQWANEYWGEGNDGIANGEREIATQAARWGADQELEACCEWLASYSFPGEARDLRSARRPKPPSLKEQALEAATRLDTEYDHAVIRRALLDAIRAALEALPND